MSTKNARVNYITKDPLGMVRTGIDKALCKNWALRLSFAIHVVKEHSPYASASGNSTGWETASIQGIRGTAEMQRPPKKNREVVHNTPVDGSHMYKEGHLVRKLDS
ncbi:hypothetical protein C8R43DRAFT_942742 [Mycena crocata]|nr:hypothetical protein C8R43DRAFT_942742 [Mycena crocata]